jgi:hypothetical protein
VTGFNHGMTGAIIALTLKQPALAVPIAFASHFIQDAVPHHDYFNEGGTKILRDKFNYLLAADFLFSVVLMIILGILFPAHKWLIWFCMAAAALPDAMWAYYYLYLRDIKHGKIVFGPLARFHMKMEWLEVGWGAYLEVAWFIITGLILLRLR